MSAGLIGCMTTPAQGNVIPDGAEYACDNGKFGKGWPGEHEWFAWLTRTVTRYGPDRCLWAVAPDVPFDAAGTLAESLPWLAKIRSLGVPAAFAAQDGCDLLDGGLPWDDFDVLFIAGSTEWKIGPVAEGLAREAATRGKGVHMGRVNSLRRLGIAEWFGCDSADGTYLAFGPDKNLPRLLRWVDKLDRHPSLFGAIHQAAQAQKKHTAPKNFLTHTRIKEFTMQQPGTKPDYYTYDLYGRRVPGWIPRDATGAVITPNRRTTATTPEPDSGASVLAATDRLLAASTREEFTEVFEHTIGDENGALARLHQFLQSASSWCHNHGAFHSAGDLNNLSIVLEELSDDLALLPDDLAIELAQPATQSSTAQAALRPSPTACAQSVLSAGPTPVPPPPNTARTAPRSR